MRRRTFVAGIGSFLAQPWAALAVSPVRRYRAARPRCTHGRRHRKFICPGSVLDASAVLVGSDTLIQTNQSLVIQLAASHRLPAIYTFRDYVDAGGLVSYGASLSDLYLDCGVTIFDDLRQGVKNIEFLADPTTGEARIGNTLSSSAAGFIAGIIDRLSALSAHRFSYRARRAERNSSCTERASRRPRDHTWS